MSDFLKFNEKGNARKEAELRKKEAEILAAAEYVFLEYGFAGSKAEMIAQKAELSVGTLYNIFGSKENLYAILLERIGRDLIVQVESVMKKYPPLEGVEKIILYRLMRHRRLDLFLAPFGAGYLTRDLQFSGSGFDTPRGLYYRYVDALSQIIASGVNGGVFEPVNPFSSAIALEGILNSFVNYWLDPKNPRQAAYDLDEIRKAVMEQLRLRRSPSAVMDGESCKARVPGREVFITKYDCQRLKELIEVARIFDSGLNHEPLDILKRALENGRIINSEDIPKDVVTMNSKIRLYNQKSGERQVLRLVFPADSASSGGTISILTPFGALLLGEWKGALIECTQEGMEERYLIEEILYQPEAAGDFHL